MAVLGLDSSLVFFDLGGCLFDNFHVDDVVAAVHAVCFVPANEHSDILWNTLSRHVSNARPPQIMEVKSEILSFLLRVAHPAFATIGNNLLAVTTLKPAQSGADASVPPRIPEVSHGCSVLASEHEVIRLLSMGTAHEDTQQVFGHADHALISVFCFAEINNLRHEIKVPNTETEQFVLTPPIGIGGLE